MDEVANKLALIEAQIVEIIKTQNEEVLAWNKVKIKMHKAGRPLEEIESVKSTHITVNLNIELRKLKQQRKYYGKMKPYHREYYQAHREEILAKSKQKRLAKKE